MLTEQEKIRYHRQMILPNVGKTGQRQLKKARVLCVGAGGLGSPLLLYLAAAGVGTLGIVDHDVVDVSNLHRQILYGMQDVGSTKANIAKKNLVNINPHIEILTYEEKLHQHNALNILQSYDIIADCTDNFTSRYLINDACFHLKKPNVAASIYQFEGQLSIFTTDKGPCYRCLYPEPPPLNLIPSCAEAGVFGVLPGLMGTLQANEILKWILQIGEMLVGRLLTVDALNLTFREYDIQKNHQCVLCYHAQSFHQLNYQTGNLCMADVKEISLEEMENLRQDGVDFTLLDVREPQEFAANNMGGQLIPIGDLPKRLDELEKDKLTIVHCKSGGRSKRAVAFLMSEGFTDVRNLTGGMTAWQKAQENQNNAG